MTTANQTESSIIFCHCAHTRILPSEVKEGVLGRLTQAGVAFEEVSDLCKLAADKDPKLAEIAAGENVKIAACFPRAVKWLFHAAGHQLDSERAQVLNMREQPADEVAEALVGAPVESAGELPEVVHAETSGPWKPWFPVIDYDRCTNCMQCLSFCLFDVYGVSDAKEIQVKNPTRCKTDCPACSRVCPEAAILFPKYRSGPINGAEVSDEDLAREKMQVDISSLLGGDIYSLLRNRSERARSRFSKERDEERALKERKRCLKKLKEQLDIPDEVINALPSLDMIRNRAEAAEASPETGE